MQNQDKQNNIFLGKHILTNLNYFQFRLDSTVVSNFLKITWGRVFIITHLEFQKNMQNTEELKINISIHDSM